MADGKSRTDQAAHLGRRAEAVACGKDVSAPEDGEALSPAAARQTLRELRACQTELAVQREELRGALAELDAARARYAELSSECKQAEARLRASEAGKREQEALARYSRQLIETSLDPLATISPEGIITDVNAASERVTGLSRQRLVGSHFAAHFTEPERARAGYREVLAQGRVIDYPLTFRHLSGACTEVLYNAAVYRDEQGHVVGVFAAARVSGAHRRAEAALLASEIRYRTPAEMTETGYLVLNAQGRVLHANQEYVRISGHGELRDILGKSVMEWTPEESRQDHAAAVAQCLRNGSLRDFVTEYVARGGERTPLEINAITEGEGESLRIVALCRDITERRRTEEALRQATERLTLAARAGGVGIWDYDVVNNRLTWDQQMFHLYGIGPEQFSGAYAAWQAGLHPEDRQRGDAEIKMALRGEREFDTEFRVRWPDGSTHNIRALASVQRDATGQPVRMIGTNWDITAQKQTEGNIRQQASLIRSLLDSIPDIIFFKDEAGVYLGCNPPFAEFVGRPREAIVGKTDYDLFGRDVADVFRENDRRMLELRESRHNEEWITFPDGRKKLIDTLKTPYWGAEGKLIGILGISRDITARKRAEEALRESEANFRTFFESMTDMIVVAPPTGQILYANAAVKRTLGYSAADLASMHLLHLHPADKRQEAEAIVGAMIRGERESCPLPLARQDGTLVPVETRLWFGKWNGAECLFGISKNLSTEQDAQQRFERLFRSNPSLMALAPLQDRRFSDVNDAFLTTLAYSRGEVIGRTAAELGLFPQPAQHAAVADRLREDGHVAGIEMQVRRKDGEILDGLFSGEVISSQGRQYVLSVMVDISGRKRVERELARLSVLQGELMHLATTFVNVPLERQDAAVDQSLATMGQLIQADRAYLFAYDFGRGVMSNTHEWCAGGIRPEIGNLQAVPNAMLPDWVAAHRRGEAVHVPSVAALPVESYLRQILEPQGIRSLITLPLLQGSACLGFVGFDAVREERAWQAEEVSLLRVLAELYAHFQARRDAERETRDLQKRLEEARDSAQAAALAKSLFLANMSHEIRTPLNAILGYAQIMERECRPCPVKPRLRAITRSGEHLLELITDLLELVRSDGRSITLMPSVFDFTQVLDDIRLMFVGRLEAHGMTLGVSVGPGVPRFICADQSKIRQVLVNLVGNAAKFTTTGGVRLSASLAAGEPPDGVTVTVAVADTGCGIRDDEQVRIFDLFYLAENNVNTAKGTGLGLPLSRRYARALGGDVTVTSRLGEGSCFRFTFSARIAADAGEVQPLQRGSVRRLAADQDVCRVLVVDDDQAGRDMLAAMLTEAGFSAVTVAGAAPALELLRQDQGMALVLLDKSMPGMDGYEAIARLRDLAGGRKLAVLIVTASGFADERDHALAVGADGYVAKPVRREELLREIGRVTGVRYDYEPTPPVARAAPASVILDPAALARLSAEQLLGLDHALHRGDIRQLRDLVEAIGRDHTELAASMRVLVDAYDYDRLRRLLDAAREETV